MCSDRASLIANVFDFVDALGFGQALCVRIEIDVFFFQFGADHVERGQRPSRAAGYWPTMAYSGELNTAFFGGDIDRARLVP